MHQQQLSTGAQASVPIAPKAQCSPGIMEGQSRPHLPPAPQYIRDGQVDGDTTAKQKSCHICGYRVPIGSGTGTAPTALVESKEQS